MTYKEPTNYNAHFDISISPFIDGNGNGNITVDSDQPNQGSNISLPNGLWLKARKTNTGVVYFSFDSGVDSTDFELSPGDIILVQVQNLNEIWFKADTVGDKFCWLKA